MEVVHTHHARKCTHWHLHAISHHLIKVHGKHSVHVAHIVHVVEVKGPISHALIHGAIRPLPVRNGFFILLLFVSGSSAWSLFA